jgi:hypothetical protein
MEVRGELIKVTLSLYDINIKDVETFLSILSTSGIRSCIVGFVVPRGKPR